MTEDEARDIAYKDLNYDENGKPYDREPYLILDCIRKDEDRYVFEYIMPNNFKNIIYVFTKTGRTLPAPR